MPSTNPATAQRMQLQADDASMRLRNIQLRATAKESGKDITTSVLARGRIFEPTTSPNWRDTFDSPDVVPNVCTTAVCGRLGQTHQALLESILLRATDWNELDDGGRRIHVRMASLSADLGISCATRRHPVHSIQQLLDDLRDTNFRLSDFGKSWWRIDRGRHAPSVVEGSFLSAWTAERIAGTAKGKRKECTADGKGQDILLAIDLSPACVQIFTHDKVASSRSRIAVRALHYGVSQAAARYLMSHSAKDGSRSTDGWWVDTVLDAVLCPIPHCQQDDATEKAAQQAVKHARRRERSRLKSEPAILWQACGIECVPSGRSFKMILLPE